MLRITGMVDVAICSQGVGHSNLTFRTSVRQDLQVEGMIVGHKRDPLAEAITFARFVPL